MQTLSYSLDIAAAPHAVWAALTGPDTYRAWTSVFTPGSCFEGDWAPGSRIRFLDGQGGGMVSEIAENLPGERVRIRHLGEVRDGVDDTTSDAATAWAPAYETYHFQAHAGGTRLVAEVDTLDAYVEFMDRTFPEALRALQALVEPAERTGGMTAEELLGLVGRVFQPGPQDRGLAVLVDLPDATAPDTPAWRERRAIASAWTALLAEHQASLGMPVSLVLYPNVHTNNGDLPGQAWLHPGGPLPASTGQLDPAAAVPFAEVYARNSILIALTTFSATAPLKVAARQQPIRAATMPGFSRAMLPSLRLVYAEVNRRVDILKALLDQAEGADFRFISPAGEDRLHLDLRHRTGHASGGLIPNLGVAGNLPSGEAYIVPYEGERTGDPSRSAGTLPVQFGPEVVRYRIEANKAVEVLPGGPEAEREAALLAAEPAYGNMAELGLGVLAAFGVKPVGTVLLDEKLGLHIAFGRSEHFGGQVGPSAFSRPEAVVHIDRVYVPETQPAVQVAEVVLHLPAGPFTLMKDNAYAAGLF